MAGLDGMAATAPSVEDYAAAFGISKQGDKDSNGHCGSEGQTGQQRVTVLLSIRFSCFSSVMRCLSSDL